MRLSKKMFVIFFITLLGGVLRWHNYAQFPAHYRTGDEMAWTWQGASLLKEQVPTSWSLFKSYQPNYIFKERGNDAPLVRPSLDHPPLFGLIPGSIQFLTQDDVFQIPSMKAIRFPMVLIGSFNVLLFSLVVFKIFPQKSVASLTSLFFATAPLIVNSSRLAVADNLLATLVLACFIALSHLKKHQIELLVLISFLAILTKIQGVFIGSALMLYFFSQKKYGALLKIIGGMIVALLLFAAYGYFYNWQLFVAVLSEQANRNLGLATLIHRFFFHPSLTTQIWPTLTKGGLLIATSLIVTSKQKEPVWRLAGSLLIAYLVVAVAAFDETNINGWYEYALYPVLFLSMGPIIEKLTSPVSKLGAWLIWLLAGLPLLEMLAINLGQLDPFNNTLIKFIPLIGGLAFLPLGKKFQRYAVWGILISVIVLQIWTNWTLTDQAYSHHCFLLSQY